MKVITYRVSLLEPALVTALDGDPNSATAFDFLPGSALRGALIYRYWAARGVNARDLPSEPDAPRLFFNGSTRYLNGYLVRDNTRLLPTPLSWQYPKGEPSILTDIAQKTVDGEQAKKKWQGVGAKFCHVQGAHVALAKPLRHLAVHTARDRRYGRARRESGAVYRYESLAAGQTFEAAIVCDVDSDADTLLPLLAGDVTLGGSRSGGYGLTRIESPAITDGANWRETGGNPVSLSSAQPLAVTLLSDALVRDANGQYAIDRDALAEAVMRKLGGGLTLTDVFVHGRAVGGFNRKAGLPLAQALAAQMGSVIVFDASKTDPTQLPALIDAARELERTGFGERRAEGFGRVAVNWQSEPSLTVVEFTDEESDSAKPPASEIPRLKVEGDGRALAERMVRRMARRRLDEEITARANRLEIKNPPKRAQLSRLRSVVYDELRKSNPDPAKRMREYLKQVRERGVARRQFEQARIDGAQLIDWLDPDKTGASPTAWQALKIEDIALPGVGDVTPAVNGALRAEYVLRLIDAALARAAKQAREEER